MMPMLGSLDCCALAASGQPTAAPPTTLMNSRRFTQPSPTLSARPGTGLRLAHPEESGDGLRDKSLRDGPMSALGQKQTSKTAFSLVLQSGDQPVNIAEDVEVAHLRPIECENRHADPPHVAATRFNTKD